MHSDIVPISDLTENDIEGWRELASASVEHNPYVEPDFVLPAMRAWGGADVGVLRVMNGTAWLAAVPVVSEPSWRGVPGRCLVVWRHPYCYLSNPLLAGGDVERVVAALIERGHRHAGGFGLEWIATDGPFGAAMRLQPRLVVISEFDRAALHGEDGDGAVNARTARNLRRKRRLLEREHSEPTIRDRSGDRAVYARFLEIEAAGWKGWSGTNTAMACIPGHADFFTDMCEGFASLGRLRLPALDSDGSILAVTCDLVAGDMLYSFKGAFDERYARFSPGSQLLMATMEAFRSEGWKMFDSCAGADNETYNGLWRGRRTVRTVIATGADRTGTLVYAKWRAAVAMRSIERRLRERRRQAVTVDR
jgi:CelD/BcsL family acetyltransferase involved in cellulose biosynthesis